MRKAHTNKNIYAFVDVETTGMGADKARVIDIGVIRIEDSKEVARFSSFVNPGISVPSTITAITGIAAKDLVDAPTFEDLAPKLHELFADAIFVAHNAAFDYSFIKAEMNRIGFDFHMPRLCSVQLSRALYPDAWGHSLDHIIDRFNICCSARHRALPDAEVIIEFFTKAKNELGEKNVNAHIRNLLYKTLPEKQLGRDAFTHLHDGAGVYQFYDKDGALLYIGKSKHVRTRVMSHFASGVLGKDMRLCKETARIECIPTSGELSALLLESALIKKDLPIYNRLLRRKKMLALARKTVTDDGYFSIEIEKASKITNEQDIVGVFRSITQAKNVIDELSSQYRLCKKLLNLEKGTQCFGSHIGTCNGACVAQEPADDYNKRFTDAWQQYVILAWPYAGAIMIDEKGIDGKGTVFFINQWRLAGSFAYDNGDYSEYLTASDGFDHDTYKILVRYLLDRKNKKSVKMVSNNELTVMIAQIAGNNEKTIETESFFEPVYIYE